MRYGVRTRAIAPTGPALAEDPATAPTAPRPPIRSTSRRCTSLFAAFVKELPPDYAANPRLSDNAGDRTAGSETKPCSRRVRRIEAVEDPFRHVNGNDSTTSGHHGADLTLR